MSALREILFLVGRGIFVATRKAGEARATNSPHNRSQKDNF